MAEGRIQVQNPVLLVGLGGTGKQIMMNFRRMVYDAYNEATYPYVGHLMIDTDARSLTLDGREYDFVTRSIDFDATEKVDAELKKTDQANYQERPEAHRHITSWFDPSLHGFGRIEHGAGRIRSFGRLAFFNKYAEIMEKVRAKVDAIRGVALQKQVSKELNLDIDARKLDIWIILSVAGGTGSGMFLDAAFALKQEFPDASIKGIVVLPTVFSEDYSHRVFANAYSALMELEHYNYGRHQSADRETDIFAEDESFLDDSDPHRFPVAWTLEQYDTGNALPGPVFDNCYIIDNKPRGPSGRVGLANKNAICEMLAEYLFIEYGSGAQALADIWRSGRSNLQNPLQNLVEYRHDGAPFAFTETFCCRHSSIGLSKLYIPSARIASIMRHRLAHDLCTSWTRPNVEPPDINERFDHDYAGRLLLARGQNQRSILRELNGPSGRDEITEDVRALVSGKRSEFLGRAATENIGDQMREWMQKEIMKQELDSTAPTPSDWGAKSRIILITNPEQLKARLTNQLDLIIDENLSQPKRRFTLARAWLRRAHELFKAQAEDYETQADRRRNRANRAARDLGDRLDWLHDRRDSFTRRQIVKVAFELMEERAVNECYAQLNNAAAELCRKMAQSVGVGTMTRDAEGREKLIETGLLNQLRALESSLADDVGGELERRLASLKRMVENPVYTSLYEEGDSETFYRTGDGKPIDGRVIADLEKRFFQEFVAERYPSFWEMRRVVEKQGADRLVNDLLRFARLETPHLDTHAVGVIDRLAKRHRPSDPQFEAEAIRLLHNGNPWLGEATHFWSKQTEEKNVVTFRWIAIHEDPDSEANRAFRDVLVSNSDENRQFVDSAPDRVYVVSEMAGFPLMSIPELEKYRDLAYLPLMRKEVIHSDYNVDKFRDLLLKDQKGATRYKEVLRIVAEAILTGVLESRLGRGKGGKQVQLHLFFQDPENVHEPESSLGPASAAIWRLASDGAARMLREVGAQVSSVKNGYGEAKLAQLAYLLNYHGNAHTIPHADLCIAMRALAKQRFFDDPNLREEARMQGPKMKDWAVARPAKTGLWVMPGSGGSL